MFTYENMKSNYETIKEFCHSYRVELTVYAGIIVEQLGGCTYSDYVKFMNELSDEEFVGNYLNGLLADTPVDDYRPILDGKMTFDEYVENCVGEDIVNIYYEKMKELKEAQS